MSPDFKKKEVIFYLGNTSQETNFLASICYLDKPNEMV